MTMGKHIDEQTAVRIKKAWTQGVALADIAYRFNLSQGALKQLAKREEWPVHPNCKCQRERKQ